MRQGLGHHRASYLQLRSTLIFFPARSQGIVGDKAKQDSRNQHQNAVISRVALQDARHLRVQACNDQARYQHGDNNAGNCMGRAFLDSVGKNGLGECDNPQYRQAHQNAAERYLLDGLPQIRGIERGGLQPREHPGSGGSLEEVRKQRRQQTPGVHPTLSHIVNGKVVIRAKVEERPESCTVIQHDSGGNRKVRGQQAGKLLCALL